MLVSLLSFYFLIRVLVFQVLLVPLPECFRLLLNVSKKSHSMKNTTLLGEGDSSGIVHGARARLLRMKWKWYRQQRKTQTLLETACDNTVGTIVTDCVVLLICICPSGSWPRCHIIISPSRYFVTNDSMTLFEYVCDTSSPLIVFWDWSNFSS